jgi:hypothetical protein
MSTAITLTTKRRYIPKALTALAIGATLSGVYLLQHHAHKYNAINPADLPFLHPGPPADLITMLQNGYDYSPFNPKSEGIDLPDEAQAIIMKALCKVILNDYHSYRYGSTQGDVAQQALVNEEAEQLVSEVSEIFADRTRARHDAELALAQQAAYLYDEHNLDPQAACKMLDNSTAQLTVHE